VLKKSTASPVEKPTLKVDESKRSIIITHTINVGTETPEKVFFLLRHLDRYYFKLSSAHQEFCILNGDKLRKGAQIFNREHIESHSITHMYTVDHFMEERYIKLISHESTITKQLWPFCQINIKLRGILEFNIRTSDTKETLLTCTFSLIFFNSLGFMAGHLSGTELAWSNHLQDEMSQIKEVLASAEFLKDFKA
jgi:hypothetical protein